MDCRYGFDLTTGEGQQEACAHRQGQRPHGFYLAPLLAQGVGNRVATREATSYDTLCAFGIDVAILQMRRNHLCRRAICTMSRAASLFQRMLVLGTDVQFCEPRSIWFAAARIHASLASFFVEVLAAICCSDHTVMVSAHRPIPINLASRCQTSVPSFWRTLAPGEARISWRMRFHV